MPHIKKFALEDFFRCYEFRKDLINLGSSDSLPWSIDESCTPGVELLRAISAAGFAYPNIDGSLAPSLRSFSGLSDDSGIDVLPTNGAAEAIFVALQAISVDKEPDPVRIAIPRPCYGAFDGIAALLKMDVQSYPYVQSDNWKLDESALFRLARDCQIVVVNNPHNPTGSVVTESLLKQLAQQLNGRGSLIVDEVFRRPTDKSAITGAPNVITIGSLSKIYGLPGLRFGWMAGPKEFVSQARTIQQYTSLSISSFAAAVGVRVLGEPTRYSRCDLLATNRAVLRAWAEKHEKAVQITPPVGGTTVVMEVIHDDPEEALFNAFESAGVLLVPGCRCFEHGEKPWFRLGYGLRTEHLRAGLKKIIKALGA